MKRQPRQRHVRVQGVGLCIPVSQLCPDSGERNTRHTQIMSLPKRAWHGAAGSTELRSHGFTAAQRSRVCRSAGSCHDTVQRASTFGYLAKPPCAPWHEQLNEALACSSASSSASTICDYPCPYCDYVYPYAIIRYLTAIMCTLMRLSVPLVRLSLPATSSSASIIYLPGKTAEGMPRRMAPLRGIAALHVRTLPARTHLQQPGAPAGAQRGPPSAHARCSMQRRIDAEGAINRLP